MDFRDTFVWKSDGSYYMIVGSGIQNSGGGILFTYKSDDLINWTSIDPLYRNVYINETGYFWEMPFFYPLNDKNEYILGVNPTPTPNKAAETLYWIGKWENERFTPYFSSPKKMELINSLLLAPAISSDTSGKVVYIGIIPEDRDANAQIAGEWRHTFSLPRAIRLLSDSAIGQIPHPNLCRLRDSLTQVYGRIILPGTGNNIPEFFSNQAEMNFRIKADSASRFSIQVMKHEDTQEFTSIIFDLSLNKIAFDRAHSSLYSGTPKDNRSSDYIFNFRDTINVTIFLDHSVIEVFVDNLAVFSFRVYPSRLPSQKVDFIVNKGRAEIISLDAWQLKDMNDVISSEVCEPAYLPDRFRRFSDLLGTDDPIVSEGLLKLFPNPANKELFIEFPNEIHDSISISVIDESGKVILKRETWLSNEKIKRLDVSGLMAGKYILIISGHKIHNNLPFIIIN
jgi:beta-fructofuranosidase